MTGEAILARSCVERQAGAEDHLVIGIPLHGNALCDVAIQSRTLKVPAVNYSRIRERKLGGNMRNVQQVLAVVTARRAVMGDTSRL